MVASLNEINSRVAHHIDEAMLLRDTSRPDVSSQIFEWFWIADAAEWIAHDRLDQGQYSKRGSPLGLHPITQIFTKFRLEHSIAA